MTFQWIDGISCQLINQLIYHALIHHVLLVYWQLCRFPLHWPGSGLQTSHNLQAPSLQSQGRSFLVQSHTGNCSKNFKIPKADMCLYSNDYISTPLFRQSSHWWKRPGWTPSSDLLCLGAFPRAPKNILFPVMKSLCLAEGNYLCEVRKWPQEPLGKPIFVLYFLSTKEKCLNGQECFFRLV